MLLYSKFFHLFFALAILVWYKVSLSFVLDSENSENPIMVVPESSLSDPIEINFHLSDERTKQEPAGSDLSMKSLWTVQCDAKSRTCYRMVLADTMQTVLQIKISFCKSYKIFGTWVRSSCESDNYEVDENSVRIENFCAFGSAPTFLFERETSTTSRDWKDNLL